jgi:signal transduction histidine kinase/ActR/RegA family two-component response regulator
MPTRRAADPAEQRILVLAPIGRDGALACAVLQEAGMLAAHCADGEDVLRHAESGVGALLLTEDVVGTADMVVLEKLIQGQPTWSDLPVVVFASREPTSRAGRELVEHTQPLGNVTVLERPVHRATLISAVHSALRARERQYEVRDLLAAHERGVRLRDEFLAMLGHELRNPLGAIRNTLSAIDLRDGASDPEGPRLRPRDRALITRQVTHLTRLVDDLLDVSRVTSGKVTLKSERVDLVDLLLRCVQSVEEMARLHGPRLEFSAGADSVMVTGDPTRLEQVATNLLTNAIKYTPPEGTIGVRVEATETEAVLAVNDTGAGLSPDMLERVFDLFSQSDRTLERAQGGLGIGLTLVRALVRQHGGEVTARSPGPGRGSTFEVRLPLLTRTGAPRDVAAPAPAAVRRPATGAPLRVLIVEDNDDNRESLVLLLEQLGHAPSAAADGPAALKRLAGEPFDLAIIDIGLPGMDGYELARQVRGTLASSVSLVALTGYGQPEDRERARAAGFDDHVTKPADLNDLAGVLARVSLTPHHRSESAGRGVKKRP